jgi:NADH-quinone oxidoreductase B subunit
MLFLIISLAFSKLFSIFGVKGTASYGKTASYACGEDYPINRAQPDYRQYFPFAFFFTVMHVAALVIATVPKGFTGLAVFYLIAAVMALVILFKKK